MVYELSLSERDTSALTPSEALLLSEDFSGFNIGISVSNKDVGANNLLDSYTQTPGWTGYKLFATNAEEVKMGSAKEAGYIVTPLLGAPECNAVTVRILCRKYSNDSGSLQLSIGDNVIGTLSPTDQEAAYVFSVECTEDFQLRVATTSGRAYVSDIRIYDGTYTAEALARPDAMLRKVRQVYTEVVAGTQHTFDNLDAGKIYSYKVRAITADATSPWSNTVSVVLAGQGSGICKVSEDDGRQSVAVYDLSGRKIANGSRVNGLPKGIYIYGGRKVLERDPARPK